MKTYYRIVEEVNGLGDVSYVVLRSNGFIERYIFCGWWLIDRYGTIEEAKERIQSNIRLDLIETVVKSKVVK